jgi:DNA-directed RNA polymerase specialized sigma24 family protein
MKDADKAFDDFVRARSPALVRYGYVLAGNPHDAADLAQEALARLGSAWERVRRKDDPEGFVRTTMVRLHVSRWRRLRRAVVDPSHDVGADVAVGGVGEHRGDRPGATDAERGVDAQLADPLGGDADSVVDVPQLLVRPDVRGLRAVETDLGMRTVAERLPAGAAAATQRVRVLVGITSPVSQVSESLSSDTIFRSRLSG